MKHATLNTMAFKLLEPTKHDVYPFIDPRDGLKGEAAGKTVLVTGSGSGIGRSIAESFALAGAPELILAARRAEPLEETRRRVVDLAPKCKVSVLGGINIADRDSVENLFGSLQTPPDILVSNAAVSLPNGSIAESDPSNWSAEIDINIKGTYLVARAYLRAVHAAGKEGCLINVSSNASWRYVPTRSSYAAAKVAMNSMTEYIHREEEASGGGVRCVAMHPGGVLTDLVTGDIPEDIRRILIDTPALPGCTAVYLSTDRARFLMSRFVMSTWDMEELEKHQERIENEDLLKTRVVGITA